MVEEQLAGAVKGIRQMVMVKQLKEMAEGGPTAVQAGGMPAAQSVHEVVTATVQAATGVAALHKGAAEVAMAQAKEARLEAKEAKEQSDGAYAAGVQETEAKSEKAFAAQERYHERTMAMFDKVTDMRVSQVEKQASDAIARITETAQTALAAKDQQIATLREQLQSVAGRKTVEEEFVAHLLGKGESPILKFIMAQSQPAAADPNLIYQAHLAPELAKLEVKSREREILRAESVEERNAEITKAAVGFVKDLGVLARTPGALAGLFNFGAAAPTAPSPGFVPNTFDAAPEPAPAQPAAAAFAGITLDEEFGGGGVF